MKHNEIQFNLFEKQKNTNKQIRAFKNASDNMEVIRTRVQIK